MSITVGRRFDYDDPNFKYFVQLLHETVTNAAFAGPLNFIPFLAKIPGDPFRGNRMKQIAEQIFAFFRGYISEHEQTLDSNTSSYGDGHDIIRHAGLNNFRNIKGFSVVAFK
jgi:hypothetical protein